MSIVTLTSGDDDRLIEINVGDAVVLTLPENPATGFQWTVASLTGGLKVLSAEFTRGPTKPGAPGERKIHVQATSAGPGTLAVRYARPWQSEADRSRQSTFTFSVR